MNLQGSIARVGSGQIIVGQHIQLAATFVDFTSPVGGGTWEATYQTQNADRTWNAPQFITSGLVPSLVEDVKQVVPINGFVAPASGFIRFGLSLNGGVPRMSTTYFVAVAATPRLVARPGDSAVIADSDIDAVIQNIGGSVSAATTARCRVQLGGVQNPSTGVIEFADPTWHQLPNFAVPAIGPGGSKAASFKIASPVSGYVRAEVTIDGGSGYEMNGAQIV